MAARSKKKKPEFVIYDQGCRDFLGSVCDAEGDECCKTFESIADAEKWFKENDNCCEGPFEILQTVADIERKTTVTTKVTRR